MDKRYLNRGIICVLVGICFILAAVFTESALDGLLWGLAGGALGPGIGMIIMHFYWSSPQNIKRYKEKQEQKNIEVHDELNEKLRDKSGRIKIGTPEVTGRIGTPREPVPQRSRPRGRGARKKH